MLITPRYDAKHIKPLSVSLEMLYLGGNLITSIPPELANLPYLSYLVLCDNRIQGVPPQLTR
jgi:Leucine-rich repeat (LRR) protein